MDEMNTTTPHVCADCTACSKADHQGCHADPAMCCDLEAKKEAAPSTM